MFNVTRVASYFNRKTVLRKLVRMLYSVIPIIIPPLGLEIIFVEDLKKKFT